MKSTLFPLVRKVHFFSAAALALVLILYVATSFFMEYSEFLPGGKASTTRTIELTQPAPSDDDPSLAREWAIAVDREHDLPGHFMSVQREADGRWRVDFDSPSGRTRLYAAGGALRAEAQLTDFGPVPTLNRLHQLRGSDASIVHVIWGLLVDAVGIAMILFSLTGVYLWYVSDRDWLGVLLLFAGAIFVLGSVVHFV